MSWLSWLETLATPNSNVRLTFIDWLEVTYRMCVLKQTDVLRKNANCIKSPEDEVHHWEGVRKVTSLIVAEPPHRNPVERKALEDFRDTVAKENSKFRHFLPENTQEYRREVFMIISSLEKSWWTYRETVCPLEGYKNHGGK